jgi:AraC family transcriptional regulator
MGKDARATVTVDVSRYGAVRQPRHSDAVLQVSLLLRGTLIERVGRVEERAGPLTVVVKAPGVEHADDYGREGVLIFRLSAPADAVPGLLDDPSRLPGWQVWHGPAVLRPMARLLRRLESAGAGMGADDADVVNVLAAITPDAPRPRGTPPSWLELARGALDDGNGTTRVSVVARDAGVHPVYLARCFRRWYGCSVAGYLGRVRLQRAACLLQQPDFTLSRVAHGAGFSDHAHFANRFRAATGLSPSHFRALVEAADGRGVERLTAA